MTSARITMFAASGDFASSRYNWPTAITWFGEARNQSSTDYIANPQNRTWFGIRFRNTPLDLENIRRARLQLTCSHPYVQPRFRLRAHKVANSPAFGSNANAIIPRFQNEGTTAYLDVDMGDLVAAKPFEIPDPNDQITAMVEEVITTPGWVPGNPITFVAESFGTVDAEARYYGYSSVEYGPALIVKYGDLATNATEWQQVDLGDSEAAYLAHDGYEVASLAVIFMGSTTVGKAAAGMKNTDGYNFYGGDNFRGYETPATIERIWNDRWGEENHDMYRLQAAVAGSTLAQWYADISNPTGGKWGDPSAGWGARYKLANPTHPWQLIWLSGAGNDMHAFGGQNRLISEEDNNVSADAAWQAYIDTYLEGYLRGVIDHALYWVANPDHAWLILPGYPNFCVKKSLNATPQILPASGSRLSNSQDTFRAVYSLNVSIGGCQFLYDSIGYSANGEIHQPFDDLSLQSALVRAGAVWQNANHPEEIPAGWPYNPNGAWWGYGLTQVNFPTLGPLSYTTWAYGGVNRWWESYRNVHDINVNKRFNMLDAMYQKVADDYDRVLFLPAKQSMGIDSVYSEDPLSPYAQSDPLDWVEGIHPNKDGMLKWLGQADADGTPSILERLERKLPFMQRFSDGIYFSYDGTLEPATMVGAYDGIEALPLYIDWEKSAPPSP